MLSVGLQCVIVVFPDLTRLLLEEISIEEFHIDCHLGYRSQNNLAILDLRTVSMSPTKFLFNLAYMSGTILIPIKRRPPQLSGFIENK